jgi:hypothetical protein
MPILLLLTATPHQGDEYLFLHLLRLIDPVLFTSTQSLTPALVQEVAVRNKKRAAVDFDGKRLFKHRITSMIEISRNWPENEQELRLYELVTEYTSEYYNKATAKQSDLKWGHSLPAPRLFQQLCAVAGHAPETSLFGKISCRCGTTGGEGLD